MSGLSKNKSPNDASARYYDIVNSKLRPQELTFEEIKLIKKLLKDKKNPMILDIGAGTGRHVIPLVNQQYNVCILEESKEMIKVLSKKLHKFNKLSLEIFNRSVFDFKSDKKFDLILLFWNTWNEIALNDDLSYRLAKILKNLLEQSGYILINSDDPEIVNFEKLSFESEVSFSGKLYIQKWTTVEWNDELKLSNALEEIIVKSKNKDKLISSTYIKQRWYTIEDFKKIFKPFGMIVQKLNVKNSNEFYLKISNNINT